MYYISACMRRFDLRKMLAIGSSNACMPRLPRGIVFSNLIIYLGTPRCAAGRKVSRAISKSSLLLFNSCMRLELSVHEILHLMYGNLGYRR